MKPEAQVFVEASAVLRDHADLLVDTALILTGPGDVPGPLARQLSGTSRDAFSALLREAAALCQTCATRIELDLWAAEALDAMTALASAL